MGPPDIKQLLDEVEHDIVNYQNRGCVICRSRRLRQITQTRGFDNSRYHAKTEFNNCFFLYVFKQFAITFSSAGVNLRQNIGQSGFILWFLQVLLPQIIIQNFYTCFCCSLSVFRIFFSIKTFNSSSETEANRSAIFSKVWKHYTDEGLGN